MTEATAPNQTPALPDDLELVRAAVQDQFKQSRDEVEAKLVTEHESPGSPSYPQVVDPSILRSGDVLNILNGFERWTIGTLVVNKVTYQDDQDTARPQAMIDGVFTSQRQIADDGEFPPEGESKEMQLRSTAIGMPPLSRTPDQPQGFVATLPVHLVSTAERP